MARRRHTAEEIVAKLRQVDVLTAQGQPVVEVLRARTPATGMRKTALPE